MTNPSTVHTAVVVEVSVTGRPELAVGATVTGDWVRFLGPGFGNVIVWFSCGPGVTALDGADAGPGPAALVARTVNVYEVPFVRPVTTAVVVEPPTVAVMPPGLEVTVYPVIGLPPSLAGAVHETPAWALPRTAVMPVGAPGAVAVGAEPTVQLLAALLSTVIRASP